MKLNIGDYVRTKDGTIGKIIAIDLAKPRQEKYPNHPSKSYWRDKILISCYRGWRTLQNIEKISSNIIDLIEEGDYVNGYRVLNVLDFNDNSKMLSLEKIYDSKITNEDIKSIVTKEQFSCMEYKIGE